MLVATPVRICPRELLILLTTKKLHVFFSNALALKAIPYGNNTKTNLLIGFGIRFLFFVIIGPTVNK